MHNPALHRLLAQARADELRRSAGSSRRVPGPPVPAHRRRAPVEEWVTLRFAFPDDARALARLAALDSTDVPAAPLLVAEVGGELRAALSLSDGAVIADPFHPSSALADLLRARAAQLTRDGGDRPRRGRRRWALAARRYVQ